MTTPSCVAQRSCICLAARGAHLSLCCALLLLVASAALPCRAQPSDTAAAEHPLYADAGDDTPTRADQWRARRHAKRQAMQPSEAGWLDRAEGFVRRTRGAILGDQVLLDLPTIHLYGIRPVFGGLPANAAFPAGLYYQPGRFGRTDRHLHAQALASLNGYYGAEAIYGAAHGPLVHYAYARYNRMPRERFYGIGPTSREADESIYGLNELLVGGLVGRSLADNLLVGAHASYRANRFGRGVETEKPLVVNQFDAGAVPGVGTAIDYVMLGGFLEYDSRNIPYERGFGQRFSPVQDRLRRLSLDATSGLYVSTQVTHHHDVGYDAHRFTRFSIDVQEYLSTGEGAQHGVAFRQFVSLTHTENGQSVPFYRLQSIGGDESLRGYAPGRFRDRNIILLNAEVRCQVWHWLDMAVFGDAGHVFHAFEDLGVNTLRADVGVGFRLRTNEGTAARFEVARGTEGVRVQLELGSIL